MNLYQIRSTRKVLVCAAFASIALFAGASSSLAGQVNFEALSTGTVYGNGINSPGDVVITQDDIEVSVVNFQAGSFEDFNVATINAPGTDLFASKHAFMNNINFEFDFSGIAPINSVTIDYHEFGGTNNFAVNGGSILELPAMTSLPALVAPGVTATVDSDSITLSGPITSVLIGGQELALDNIVAVPEPASLAILALGMGAAFARRHPATKPA
jgi:hypothetical protein